MMKKLILIFFSLLPQIIQTQNLVIDGGFEDVTLLLNESGEQIYRYNKWMSLLPLKHRTKNGAPYFPEFLKRKRTNDNKIIRYYTPYEGNCFLECFHPSLRNLYQNKLIRNIHKDSIYKISFKLKVISDFYLKNKVEKSINGKIGVWFTTKSLNDSISRKILMNPKIKLIPSVVVDNYSYDCEEKWISFSEIWKADKDYKYIIIGNFEKIIRGDEIGYYVIKGVTYDIDNLKVIEINSNTSLKIGEETITDCSQIKENIKDGKDSFLYPEFNKTIPFDSTVNEYYSLIQKAEESIINNDFSIAISLYFKAFNIKKPYFEDYFNLKNLLNSDTGSYKIELDSLRSFNYSFGCINKNVCSQIDSIFRLDQHCRMKNDSIALQDSSNFEFLKHLYESDESISEISIGHNSMNRLNTLLLHHSRYKFFKLMLNYLYRETRNGNFRNRDFAFLIDSYVKFNNTLNDESYYCTDCAIPIYTKFVIPKMDSSKIGIYNSRRKAIYIEPLSDQYKKQYYNFKNGYNLFNFYTFFTMFPTDPSIPDSQKLKFIEQEKKIISKLKAKYGEIEIR